MAKLNVEQMKNLAMLQQLDANFLAQPGIDIRDLRQVLSTLDRVHMASKLVKAIALIDWETRKLPMTDRDPMRRMRFTAKPDDWVLRGCPEDFAEVERSFQQAGSHVSPQAPAPPAES